MTRFFAILNADMPSSPTGLVRVTVAGATAATFLIGDPRVLSFNGGTIVVDSLGAVVVTTGASDVSVTAEGGGASVVVPEAEVVLLSSAQLVEEHREMFDFITKEVV